MVDSRRRGADPAAIDQDSGLRPRRDNDDGRRTDRDGFHFIDGKDVASVSGRTFASIDPSTGGELAQVAFGEAADVDAAVAAARRTFEAGAWAKLSPSARERSRRLADLIHDSADRIGAIESRDTGKPLGQAIAEVHVGADFITYFAGHAELPDGRTHPADAGYFVYSKREPYGVVGAISPGTIRSCWPAGRPRPRSRWATRRAQDGGADAAVHLGAGGG